jgi:hypothetical protein
MLGQSSYISEFLSEANLILTRENFGNKMDGVIQPIRNLFLKEKDLLAFSLARYCGADSRLAFTCEWLYQSTYISLNPAKLNQENINLFRKKVPLRLRGVPNLHSRIDEEINSYFLPLQLNFLLSIREDLLCQINKNYPNVEKYLNRGFISQIIANCYQSNLKMYSQDLPLKTFLDCQYTRTSFLQVALPCLVGFTYQFNLETNLINPNGIRWSILEEVLKQIAFLHQTGSGQDPLHSLERFVYMSRLSERDEFDWWQKDLQKQYQQVIASPEARELAQTERNKVYSQAKTNIANLILPEKYPPMIQELLEWAYSV